MNGIAQCCAIKRQFADCNGVRDCNRCGNRATKMLVEAAQDKVFAALRDQIRLWREKQDLLERELEALQTITKEFNHTAILQD